MSTDNNTTENEAPAVVNATSSPPGQQLKAERLAKGLEVATVAQELHLDRKTIAALEEDDYSNLPAAIFTQGYLRSYATLLGLSPEPLLLAYKQFTGAEEKSPPLVVSQPSLEESGGGGAAKYFWIVAFAAIIGVLVWWYSQPSHEPVTTNGDGAQFDLPEITPGEVFQPEALRPQTPVVEAPPASEGMPAPSTEDEPAEADPEPTAAERIAAARAAAAAEEPAAEPEAVAETTTETAAETAPVAGDQLTLKLSNDSWVRITDATEKRLLSRLLKAGEERTVAGQAPFQVLLGYAKGVAVSINGTAFDHTEFQRSNLTARFEVPAE